MVANNTNKIRLRKPGAGRKKSPTKLLTEALARADQKFPEMYEALQDIALGSNKTVICPDCGREIVVYGCSPDKDVLIYLVDRRLGKPHQSIDQRIKAAVLVTADDYEMASRLSSAAQQQVIDSIEVLQLPPPE